MRHSKNFKGELCLEGLEKLAVAFQNVQDKIRGEKQKKKRKEKHYLKIRPLISLKYITSV